jgi:ABC-2 type transport system permease protein
MELRLTARRGENLLVIAVIPAVVLVFFATIDVVATPTTAPVDFLLPGVLALGLIASGVANLGIATAYERYYGVLKRLGGSPLGRDGLLVAKSIAVAVIVAFQVVVLSVLAVGVLGWMPGASWSPWLSIGALGLGTVTFASLGLLLAGTLRAEATLALANGLFVAALLLGGIVLPISELPTPLAELASALPAAALSDALRVALASAPDVGRDAVGPGPWLVLGAWAIVSSVLALRTFSWDCPPPSEGALSGLDLETSERFRPGPTHWV